MVYSNPVVKKVLELSGFERLNPVQELAARGGVLEGKSMVVAAPTASGKTIIAELAMLSALKEGKKSIYIVPLKALAMEKYNDFREKFSDLNIRVGMSIGDLDQADPWLSGFDIVIVTSEKLDSLLRHGITWIGDVGLVVVDEVHLLNDPSRGPTLEVVLTRLMHQSNARILALSATISNYQELAEWFKAKGIKSDYRPVELYKGVSLGTEVKFAPKRDINLPGDDDPLIELVDNTLKMGKQALIFVSTRRSTESTAEKLGKVVSKHMKEDDKNILKEVSGKVLHLESPTSQCEKLSRCVLNGAAFHHAGLTNTQKSLIEKSFKDGRVKIICATPTLAAGINLPAYRVIIRDLKRFSSFGGMDYIPVLEIQQMMGRSGRPKYDKEGEAILITKNEQEAAYAWNSYVMGEPEKIYSKLGVEPILRTHVLALISSGVTGTKKEIFDFFSKTFYAYQYKDIEKLNAKLENVMKLLQDYGFIDMKSKGTDYGPFVRASSVSSDASLIPTKLGKRVSELYIDPLTANLLIKRLEAGKDKGLTPFSTLHMITNTIEMKPLIGIRKGDIERVNEAIMNEHKSLTELPPNEWDIEYDDYLKSIKTAMFFESWVSEWGENRLHEDYGVSPGELRARLDNADWLLYSTQELALLLGYKDMLGEIRKMRIRMSYGVKEELLPLIKLKRIGRVKSRKLFDSGVRSISDLRKIPTESLGRLIGYKTAEDVKKQLGEEDNQKLI